MSCFWYSEKMKAHLKLIGEPHALTAKLKDGTLAEYTLETYESKERSGWDDLRWVGEGKFHEMAED